MVIGQLVTFFHRKLLLSLLCPFITHPFVTFFAFFSSYSLTAQQTHLNKWTDSVNFSVTFEEKIFDIVFP